MAKAKRKSAEHWNENYGCDGRPPITKPVAGLTDLEKNARTVAERNTNHCTICRLHHLGHLKDSPSDVSREGRNRSDIRHRAAEHLQDLASKAQWDRVPSTMSSLLSGGGGGGGPAEVAQNAIDASRDVTKALSAVGDSGAVLLRRIVLEDAGAQQFAKEQGINSKGVTPALRVALDALAAHFGMNNQTSAKIRGGDAQPIHPFQPFDAENNSSDASCSH